MSDIEAIKYRLIGALVIVVSFIFAWWLVLDHDVQRLQDEDMEIPEPLKIERFDIDKPEKPSLKPVEAKSAEKKAAKAVKKEVKVVETDKKIVEIKSSNKNKYSSIDDRGLPEAWVVQVASFQNKPNAQKLQEKLLADDLPAYIKQFNLPDGSNFHFPTFEIETNLLQYLCFNPFLA